MAATLLLGALPVLAQEPSAPPPADASQPAPMVQADDPAIQPDYRMELATSLSPNDSLAMAAHPASMAATTALPAPAAPAPAANPAPVIMLGPGDALTLQVYGRPEMNTTAYVADDGTITVPLAGAVGVAGMSPAQAGAAVAAALRAGQYLVNPQVTVTLAQFRSQQISVLGEVRNPGRYPVESRTSVFDLLAQAGGETDNGADTIYVLRPGAGGSVERLPVDLSSLREAGTPLPALSLKGGDSVYVPRADRFYIYGEVAQPNAYRLEPDMTVIQAISRSGGVTVRGSERRVEISRVGSDGRHVNVDAKPFDRVQPDDVIRVKERLF